MREVNISKRADPAYLEAFRGLVKKLIGSAKVGAREPISMVLAGGAAMHFYTGIRISDGVDAVFNKKLLLSPDASVIYRDSKGETRTVFFDPTYNEAFALMHENAHSDARRLPLDGLEGVNVFVLTPVDLAVSKLSRFAQIDREDILALAKAGLITSKELRQRAEAALPGYVGDPTSICNSIGIACRDIESATLT